MNETPEKIMDKSIRGNLDRTGRDFNNQDNGTNLLSALIKRVRLTTKNGGFILHSALLSQSLTNLGYILAAPSGHGKTTCCSRLKHPWVALCDDEVMIELTGDNTYLAHPFPTMSRNDMSGLMHDPVPIKAIFLLDKSYNNEILAMRPDLTAYILTKLSIEKFCIYSTQMKKEEVKEYETMIFKNAWDFSHRIPSYLLRVSLSGEFWKEIEKVL
jgi:SynChlorMet cassette protein ScmC